jgi:hypothetical protein
MVEYSFIQLVSLFFCFVLFLQNWRWSQGPGRGWAGASVTLLRHGSHPVLDLDSGGVMATHKGKEKPRQGMGTTDTLRTPASEWTRAAVQLEQE